jgi:RNA recognition motif-containing protein
VQVVTVGCRIYVGNLSWDVKWQDLKDFFKPCGTVVRADVMEEPGGRSKGCGKYQSEYLIDRLVGCSLL